MTDNSLVYYLSCGWEYFKRGHFSSPKNECPWCNFKHGPWQWGWGGVEGGDGVGRRGCLSWHFSRGLWEGVGAASAPVDVSLEGMFLLISLQNSQHTDFSLAVGKSRVLSYKKMPHQGKPCVWPRKLPCRLGDGVWWGAQQVDFHVHRAVLVLVREESSTGGPSAFCQARWSLHTWIQDICFSPRENGFASCCLVSFSGGGLVCFLNLQGGHERGWPGAAFSPSELRKARDF